MQDIFKIILGSLATWRLASLLVNEDGAGHIFERLRIKAGIYVYGPQGEQGFWAEQLSCLWCTALWIAAPIAFVLFWGRWGLVILTWPALSAGAIYVDSQIRYPRKKVSPSRKGEG